MIWVDYREGSKHMVAPLQRHGVTAEIATLEFGDVAFVGRGIGDRPVNVGIELKKLNDLVASLRTGRLADHQVPGMVGPQGIYDYAWIVVEGQYRVNKHGQLITYTSDGWSVVKGNMNVSEMEKRVLTLEMLHGVHTRFTNRMEDTAAFVTNLYRWFTDKAMDDHSTGSAVHQPGGLIPVSDFRATLMVRCPGMGRATSLAAEVRFGGSLRTAAMATVADWASVSTTDRTGRVKHLGIKKAEEIVAFWRGQ